MTSPITNCHDPKANRPKLDVERARLYSPETEWTYSHHPSIRFFRDRFFAIWSNGWVDEDAPAQRVLMSSADDFSSWSEPVPLIDSLPGKKSELVLTAAGYIVSCPDPKSGRCPLVISLSQDGVTFDRAFVIADEPYEQKREGQCKGGLYGYPHTVIHEDHMYVVFSLRKEAVEVIRFKLGQLF